MSKRAVLQKLHNYTVLTRIHRPIGTLLLLWPTLWALWIAGQGSPDLWIVVLFIIGTFLTRSAGCVINDYADREFDSQVERTKDRPLATGKVTKKEALILFSLIMLCAFALVLLLNSLTIALAIVAAVIAMFYPYSKRFFLMPQLVLGVAFAWGIPMAFAAITHQVPPVAWLLFAATLCWIVAYDTIYAMMDRGDDLRIGIHSSAILFANYDCLIVAIFQVLTLVLLLLLAVIMDLSGIYYLILSIASLSFIYQQKLIRRRRTQDYYRSFIHNNYFGLLIFINFVLTI
ncbi:MAG: 4-hydroxybenzoate octaprenyltransferase [Gammaproteobacteria bacterium]